MTMFMHYPCLCVPNHRHACPCPCPCSYTPHLCAYPTIGMPMPMFLIPKWPITMPPHRYHVATLAPCMPPPPFSPPYPPFALVAPLLLYNCSFTLISFDHISIWGKNLWHAAPPFSLETFPFHRQEWWRMVGRQHHHHQWPRLPLHIECGGRMQIVDRKRTYSVILRMLCVPAKNPILQNGFILNTSKVCQLTTKERMHCRVSRNEWENRPLMNRSSLRNNQSKLIKTSGTLSIGLEEFIETYPHSMNKNRKQSTCNQLNFKTLAMISLCPKISPGHDRYHVN